MNSSATRVRVPSSACMFLSIIFKFVLHLSFRSKKNENKKEDVFGPFKKTIYDIVNVDKAGGRHGKARSVKVVLKPEAFSATPFPS